MLQRLQLYWLYLFFNIRMAKSLRSKIMRRWRSLRRGHVDKIICKEKQKKIFENNLSTIAGIEFRQKQKKNAFLHPEDPEAVFPQFVPAPIIDLRSSAIPGAGYQWSGSKSKSNRTITEQFKNYDLGAQVVMGEVQGEGALEEEKAEKEKEKIGSTNYKPRKARKSKLRKTIVF